MHKSAKREKEENVKVKGNVDFRTVLENLRSVLRSSGYVCTYMCNEGATLEFHGVHI